jgi:hypothetical protein
MYRHTVLRPEFFKAEIFPILPKFESLNLFREKEVLEAQMPQKLLGKRIPEKTANF